MASAGLCCVVCGAVAPRGEMFGVEPELRCARCADALRARVDPARIRRAGPADLEGEGSPGRVTVGLVALLACLWAAAKLDAVAEPWLTLLLQAPRSVDLVHGVVSHHPRPWQFVLWSLQHFGLVHLLMNGLTLFQLGRLVEWGFGVWRYLFVLLGSAAAGTAAGWLVNGRTVPLPSTPFVTSPTIGISGGLFGLIALLIALRRHHALAEAVVTRSFLNSILAFVVLTVLLTQFGGLRISHVGHGVGFLWGWAAALCLRSRLPALGLGLLAVATLALLALPTFVSPLGWSV